MSLSVFGRVLTTFRFLSQSIKDYLGEERLKKFIQWVLHYIADLDIPKKRCVLRLHV